MFVRRRPIARAAVVGGTAYAAGKAGARSANREAEEQAEQQAYAAPPPPAAAPPAGGMTDDKIEQLKQLAELRDSGVLTDAEFEVQKAKLLA
jgi:Short C-terminal domain